MVYFPSLSISCLVSTTAAGQVGKIIIGVVSIVVAVSYILVRHFQRCVVMRGKILITLTQQSGSHAMKKLDKMLGANPDLVRILVASIPFSLGRGARKRMRKALRNFIVAIPKDEPEDKRLRKNLRKVIRMLR